MSINDVVNTALDQNGIGQYKPQARPVVAALTAREQEIFEGIVAAGVAAGLSAENVKASLIDLGLTAPVEAPAPAAQATVGGQVDAGIAAVLARIEQTLTSLTQFARSNGYRG